MTSYITGGDSVRLKWLLGFDVALNHETPPNTDTATVLGAS